jgi:hypothetical protein
MTITTRVGGIQRASEANTGKSIMLLMMMVHHVCMCVVGGRVGLFVKNKCQNHLPSSSVEWKGYGLGGRLLKMMAED